MDFFKIIRLVAALVPIIQALVQMVENMVGSGSGEQKKEQVLNFLAGIWGFLATDAGIKEIKGTNFIDLKPLLGMVVDGIVSLANATGVFSK
jgi:hypothetical protein